MNYYGVFGSYTNLEGVKEIMVDNPPPDEVTETVEEFVFQLVEDTLDTTLQEMAVGDAQHPRFTDEVVHAVVKRVSDQVLSDPNRYIEVELAREIFKVCEA